MPVMQVVNETNPAELDLKLSLQFSSSAKGTIIVGMCEGLLHLHSRDIVHQDLKPENIMVSGDVLMLCSHFASIVLSAKQMSAC